MSAPITAIDFLSLVEKSGLLAEDALVRYREVAQSGSAAERTSGAISRRMIQEGLLTPFQARKLAKGRFRGFFLGEKYKILEQIGEGGMGRVLLCEHLILRRLVAVKLMTISSEMYPGAIERFVREARAAAALDHPHITRVFDVLQTDAGPCMVMEYVDGASLQDLVNRHGPLAIERAAHYVAQAAAGLQHAHQAGLVHRDIKPGNILVDRAGTIKLLDLGLARFFETGKNEGLTQRFDDQSVLGTADYIAPEQAMNSSQADVRADIYSLGCTLYFLLSGKVPFEGGTPMEKLMCHQGKEPRAIRELRPDVPKALEAVLAKMISKKPADRFQTPSEVVAVLAPWTAKPVPPPRSEEMQQLNPQSFKLGLSPPLTMMAGKLGANQNTPRPSLGDRETHRMSDVQLHSSGDQPPPAVLSDSSSFMSLPSWGSDPHSPAPSGLDGRPTKRKMAVWQVFAASTLIIAGVVTSAAVLASWFGGSKEPGGNRPLQPPLVAANQGDPALGLPALAPTSSGVVLRSGGSSFIAPLMEHWTPLFEADSGTKLEYASLGSSKGVEGVLSHFLDFGCTDAFVSDKQLNEADGTLVHIPLAMGAVVPTYNVNDPTGKPLKLRFTGPLLANIFLGRVTKWNDPTIGVNNPGKSLPDLEIKVVHRKDGSGTTFIWSDYLSKASSEWKSRVGAGSKLEWPVGEGAEKNDGVADAVSRAHGAIGYVELSFALANGLQVGQVKNRANVFVEPSIDGIIAAAANSLQEIPADLRYSLTDAPGKSSYPIVGTCWAVAFVDHPADKRAELVKFLRWATHDGQKHLRDLRYAPLPEEFRKSVDAAIDRLSSGR